MTIPAALQSHWEVLLLFLIPIGGGIPAGVVLGQTRGLSWLVMLGLYFISDVILACIFEPIMLAFMRATRSSARMERFRQALAKSSGQMVSRYGIKPSPFSLVVITFGTDPMTGRSVAKAAGHGFFSGWALAILGDMFFFAVIMGSTLWLNNLLGDGTWAAIIIMVAMMLFRPTVDFLRRKIKKPSTAP